MKRIYQDNFPIKIDFDYLENLEVEYYPAKVLYKSFFTFLNIPKVITMSFMHLLSSETEKRNAAANSSLTVYEKQFFKVFDEMYSLNDVKARSYRPKEFLVGNINLNIN